MEVSWNMGIWNPKQSFLEMVVLIGMMNQIFAWEMAVSPFPYTLNWLALGYQAIHIPRESPGAYLLTSLTVIVGNQILGFSVMPVV